MYYLFAFSFVTKWKIKLQSNTKYNSYVFQLFDTDFEFKSVDGFVADEFVEMANSCLYQKMVKTFQLGIYLLSKVISAKLYIFIYTKVNFLRCWSVNKGNNVDGSKTDFLEGQFRLNELVFNHPFREWKYKCISLVLRSKWPIRVRSNWVDSFQSKSIVPMCVCVCLNVCTIQSPRTSCHQFGLRFGTQSNT